MRIKALLGVVIFTSLLTSCRNTRETIPEIITQTDRTVTVIARDTVFITQPDSSAFTARLSVAPDGRVALQELLTTTGGKHLQVPKVAIRGNVLHVDCYAEAQRLFHQWRETYVQENHRSDRTITKPPQFIEKDLSVWQLVQVWLGRMFLVLLAVFALSLFIHHRLTKTA